MDVFEMLDGKRKSGVRWDGRWKPVPVLNSAIPAASLDCANRSMVDRSVAGLDFPHTLILRTRRKMP